MTIDDLIATLEIIRQDLQKAADINLLGLIDALKTQGVDKPDSSGSQTEELTGGK